MLAKVMSCAIIGLEGQIVEVEVDISQGMPAFSIVGLPDAAVRESRDRVHSAIKNCHFNSLIVPVGHCFQQKERFGVAWISAD